MFTDEIIIYKDRLDRTETDYTNMDRVPIRGITKWRRKQQCGGIVRPRIR
jgi:hypothetical protein